MIQAYFAIHDTFNELLSWCTKVNNELHCCCYSAIQWFKSISIQGFVADVNRKLFVVIKMLTLLYLLLYLLK